MHGKRPCDPTRDPARHRRGGARAEDALLERARTGDARAFASLVRREGGGLFRLAYRLTRSEADAYDCVQETFLQAHRRLDQFRGDGPISRWLHRILVNAALGRARSRSRRPEVSLEELQPRFERRGCSLDPHRPALEDAEVLVQRQRTREAVRNAIARLPEGYRDVILLRDIFGRSTAEAADELGLNEGAAKVRLHRARAALKRVLESGAYTRCDERGA